MKHIKLYESFVNERVSNSDILDLVDDIQALIQKIKAENSSKGSKLFTAAGPLIKELHSLTESLEEDMDESKGLELVHVYDKDGSMYGTGELVKKNGSKSLVRFDRDTEKWFDNTDVKLVESKYDDNLTSTGKK